MKKSILALTAVTMLGLVACNSSETVAVGEEEAVAVELVASMLGDSDVSFEALTYPEKDYMDDYDESGAIAFVDGEEIYITESGTYSFSGNYASSTIVVNVDKDVDEGTVYLLLDNVSISSSVATPIYVMEAKDIVLVLEGANTVTQGAISTTEEDFPSGAVYSAGDTVITGGGSLTITTAYLDGINSRDDLIIEDVALDITAVEDGIVGKDYLAFDNVSITIDAGKDGMKTSNDEEADKGYFHVKSGTFAITAAGDAMSAENTMQIDGGSFALTAGGGYVSVLNTITVGEGSGNKPDASDDLETSMKGVKALNILLNDGVFRISAYEDAIHANNEMLINGGTITISTGDDAVHADSIMVINNVDLLVENGYEGIEANYLTVNGGDIWISVLDDAMNAGASDGYIRITGGEIYLNSQGDGIDSNGDFYMEAGNLVIDNNAIYTGGDGAVDVTGTMSISGGSIVDAEGNEIDVTALSQGGRQNTTMTGREDMVTRDRGEMTEGEMATMTDRQDMTGMMEGQTGMIEGQTGMMEGQTGMMEGQTGMTGAQSGGMSGARP